MENHFQGLVPKRERDCLSLMKQFRHSRRSRGFLLTRCMSCVRTGIIPQLIPDSCPVMWQFPSHFVGIHRLRYRVIVSSCLSSFRLSFVCELSARHPWRHHLICSIRPCYELHNPFIIESQSPRGKENKHPMHLQCIRRGIRRPGVDE